VKWITPFRYLESHYPGQVLCPQAAGDGDFQNTTSGYKDFGGNAQGKIYPRSRKSGSGIRKSEFWVEHFLRQKTINHCRFLKRFLANGEKWPLIDILFVIQNIDTEIAKIENNIQNEGIIISTIVQEDSYKENENYQEEKIYQEEVVIKPSGLFRKAVYRDTDKNLYGEQNAYCYQTRKLEKNSLYNGKAIYFLM